MKALLVFTEEEPKKTHMKKYQKIVDKMVTPEMDVEWYLIKKDKFERVKRMLDDFK